MVCSRHPWAELVRQRTSAESLVRLDEPLARRTTFRVGGPADCYVEPAGEADLAAVLGVCREAGLPAMVLGRGSNLLVRDGGIRGVVICLAHPAFSRIQVESEHLWCGAGARLKSVVQEARRAGLGGLEFLEGIPGSVGGALRMNAGAMGSWTFEVVTRIRVMDYSGRAADLPRADLEVHYRGCPLLRDRIALGAVFQGRPEARDTIESRSAAFNQRRWSTQPAAPSAGCVFKNPAGIPAGRLIDELGLKGTRIGGAVVSDVHANFIVNDGTATAADILQLIERIRERAQRERGVRLETELEIVGEGLPSIPGGVARVEEQRP